MGKKLIDVIYEYKVILEEKLPYIFKDRKYKKTEKSSDENVEIVAAFGITYIIFQFCIDTLAFYYCIEHGIIYQISINKDISILRDPDIIIKKDEFDDLFSETNPLMFLLKYEKILNCEYEYNIVEKIKKCFDDLIRKI